MKHHAPVVATILAVIATLVLVVRLNSAQSQAAVLQYGVPLLLLAAWVWWRGSRASLVTTMVVGGLFSILSTVILITDGMDSVGPREIVPDVLVLAAALATMLTAGREVLRPRTLA